METLRFQVVGEAFCQVFWQEGFQPRKDVHVPFEGRLCEDD